MSTSPPARHRLLGAALRQVRTQKGYSLDDAATVLACHRSKISRMETGRRGIQPMELRDLLDAYEAVESHRDTLLVLAEHSQDPDWWRFYRHGADAYQDLLCLAGPAASMWAYEVQFVPGLLQTEDYALAIADAALAKAGPAAREEFMQARLARQQILIHGDDAAGFSAIFSEAVLRQVVGGRAVMWGQLRRLVEVSESQSNVTVQVLPFTNGTQAAASGPFTIMTFPGPGDISVVRLAGQVTGVYLEDEEDVTRYELIFQHLRASALSPADSAQLIKDVARKL